MTYKQDPQPDEIMEELSSHIRNLPQILKKRVSRAYQNYWIGFREVYLSSGLTKYIDDYFSKARTLTLVSTIAFTVLVEILFILLRFSIGQLLLSGVATILITSSVIGFLFIIYPYYKKGQARSSLEDGLIYFLSYMTVLSASGMSIERILERVTEVEDNQPLVNIGKKFTLNVKLFGMDVLSSLKDISEISPSKVFSKQLLGIRTTIATSGDLRSLLKYEVDRQLQVKKEKLRTKIGTLVYIGELYVAIMVVTPTLFILIIAILSILGGTSLGGSSVLQLNLIVFIGIPIMATFFTLILDQTLGKEE